MPKKSETRYRIVRGPVLTIDPETGAAREVLSGRVTLSASEAAEARRYGAILEEVGEARDAAPPPSADQVTPDAEALATALSAALAPVLESLAGAVSELAEMVATLSPPRGEDDADAGEPVSASAGGDLA